jgi:periplasmic divalent cation tolerance protein
MREIRPILSDLSRGHMPYDSVIVLTTISISGDTQRFATTLVEERLAACVSVLPTMQSTYRWKDAIEHDEERQVVIKTTRDRVDALRARFRDLHPYEVPEFLVISVADGSPEYLSWLQDAVREG